MIKKVAVHWPNFGPYHVARLEALQRFLTLRGVEITGLEIATSRTTYAWKKFNSSDSIPRKVVFPWCSYEEITSQPIKLAIGIWNALNTIVPDVIAINGYSTCDSWAIMVWAKLHAKKIILMTESKESDQKRGYPKETVKKVLVTQFSSALCGGSLHKDYLISLGMASQKIFMGYDAVDNDFFSRKSQEVRRYPEKYRKYPGLDAVGHPIFLASSRFIPRKNIKGLVIAYHQYKEMMQCRRSAPWRLVILGDGDQRQEIEQLVRTFQMEEDVVLAGLRSVDELPAYYGLASVFIHPAIQEQWGLVVNEAMASGLPVLVSRNCGCMPDLLIDGLNGYSFNPSNSEELAELMVRVSSGEAHLEEMGKCSLRLIQQWGPERFASGFYQAVQKILEN